MGLASLYPSCESRVRPPVACRSSRATQRRWSGWRCRQGRDHGPGITISRLEQHLRRFVGDAQALFPIAGRAQGDAEGGAELLLTQAHLELGGASAPTETLAMRATLTETAETGTAGLPT